MRERSKPQVVTLKEEEHGAEMSDQMSKAAHKVEANQMIAESVSLKDLCISGPTKQSII